MRIIHIASRLSLLVLLATSASACPNAVGECFPERMPLVAGDTRQGVDPRAAVGALAPQTLTLHWTEIDQSTTIRISAAATDMPSNTVSDCDGAPQFHEVPARITIDTDDGRLSTSVIVTHPVDLQGVLEAPTWVVGSIPASILAGTGVASDEAIAGSSSVNVYLQVVATPAGRAYGAVSLKLVMRADETTVAVSDG